jgi:hypothetical protein
MKACEARYSYFLSKAKELGLKAIKQQEPEFKAIKQ